MKRMIMIAALAASGCGADFRGPVYDIVSVEPSAGYRSVCEHPGATVKPFVADEVRFDLPADWSGRLFGLPVVRRIEVNKEFRAHFREGVEASGPTLHVMDNRTSFYCNGLSGCTEQARACVVVEGAAPSRTLTIEWAGQTKVYNYVEGTPRPQVRITAAVEESSGAVEYRYGAPGDGLNGKVGIVNADESAAFYFRSDVSGPFVVDSSHAVEVGDVLRFTPRRSDESRAPNALNPW